MSALQTITITDTDDTTDVVFAPFVRKPGNITILKSNNGTSAAGNDTLVLEFNENKGNRGTHRPRITLNLPLERTEFLSGTTKVDDTARITITGIIPVAMTSEEREQMVNRIQKLTSHVLVNGYLNLDPML